MALTWKPDAFKKALMQQLVANGEVVGQFVEGEAKRRLLAIQDPDWGAQYRGYVARLLDNEVKAERRRVSIRVGVRTGYTKWHGYYIELGTSRRAAHPFLRPAVFENGAKILALLGGR